MTPSLGPTVEQLVQRGGFWSIHLLRVAFLVLLAVASLLFALRLAALMVLWRRRTQGPSPAPASRPLAAALVCSLAVLAGSLFLAIKPDAQFLVSVGDAAMRENDYRRAVEFYLPLAEWGTDRVDVYVNLGMAHLKLGSHRAAADALHRAQALDSSASAETYLLCGYAHLMLGDRTLAVTHLTRARDRARSTEQRRLAEEQLQSLEQPVAIHP